jgi:hypothetical protein
VDVNPLSEEEQQQLSTQAMTKSKIEQMKKKVRMHCAAVINFDAGFCNMQVTQTCKPNIDMKANNFD